KCGSIATPACTTDTNGRNKGGWNRRRFQPLAIRGQCFLDKGSSSSGTTAVTFRPFHPHVERKTMLRLIPAAFALTISAAAVHADEFTDVVEGALEAYRAGDITVAQEELDYANTLLREMKTASLANHLPEAPDGWTREDN